MNSPKGDTLAQPLNVYGGIKGKSYRERVRTFERKLTTREELIELVKRATEKQAETLLQVAKGLMG